MAVRFLIVDDCTSHQKLMANLVSFLGGTMRYAGNGREALELARSEEFDIILMDLQMPALDGISAADRLLHDWMQHPHRPRIVAVTGDGSPGRRALCRAVGMDGHVAKPYDPATLKHCLQRVIMSGHCWNEGAPERSLDMKRFLSAALILNFDAWAANAPEQLRATTKNISGLAEFQRQAREFGFLTVERLVSPHASFGGEASLEKAAASLQTCIAAAGEALTLTRDAVLAAA